MKKLLLSAIALVACMSVKAQVVFYNDFSEETSTEGLVIINANGDYYGSDENTWGPQYYYSKNCMHNGWTQRGNGNCDDWLIMQGVELSPAYIYKYSMNTLTSGDPQTLTVELGTAQTIEAMTQNIMPAFTFTNTSWSVVESEDFTVSEAGTYYIGIHDISDEYMYNTFVTDITIEIVGEATPVGISNVNAANEGKIYTLDGRQAQQGQAGLYIQNGKKIMVK